MNLRLAGIGPSLIRVISAKRKATSIDLGLGEPTLQPRISLFTHAQAWVAEHGIPYTMNLGDAHAREAIAQYYHYPEMSAPNNVCITNGSQEAIFCTIGALLEPGRDEMLAVEPLFGSYTKIAELNGVTVQRVAMDPENFFAFDAERILVNISDKTRMIVICSPCNPTGRVLRKSEAEKLAAGLLARPGEPILVLFDEVYRELCFVEDAVDFAKIYSHTISINSLSKSNALTGLRLGWAIGPAQYIDYIGRFHAWTTSTASTYAQRIAFEIFSKNQGKLLHEHRDWYETRARDVELLLKKYSIVHTPIEGTFYTLVKLPGITDSVAAATQLADLDDVLAIPGKAFGESSEGWLRLSLVAPLERIDEGLRRMQQRFC